MTRDAEDDDPLAPLFPQQSAERYCKPYSFEAGIVRRRAQFVQFYSVSNVSDERSTLLWYSGMGYSD